MTAPFELAGREFQIGRMDLFKQFHVGRKVAPILARMAAAGKDFMALSGTKDVGDEKLSEAEKLQATVALVQPIAEGLSELDDKDSEFVLMNLLAAVEIKQGDHWAKLATPTTLMFQDMELPVLLQLAGRVFAENLGGFFGGPRRLSA